MAEPQNVYDDPAFFAGYARLARFGAGWTDAMEHPQFMSLLPDLAGRRMLDLGCGAGQLALHLAEAGAAEVIAVDLSERMLELARAERSHPRVTYRRESIEEVNFPPKRFDLVVSSLAFHYVPDYAGLIRRIADWLAPGGVLVFSTEHPIYTARASDDGWLPLEDGRAWGIVRYGDEGSREHRWFVDGVRRHHRTLATLVNRLIDAGLTLERLVEPLPSAEWLNAHQQSKDEARRPMFLLARARKA